MKDEHEDGLIVDTSIDPHTGYPMKFHRTDPTGRWSPLAEPELQEPGWVSVAGGVFLAFCLALTAFYSLSGGW